MNKHIKAGTFTIIIISMLGAGIVFYMTPYGIGTSTDSVVYIEVANNILADNGLTALNGSYTRAPLTHFPPFYPLTLTIGSLFGQTTFQFARILAGLVFGINIFLVGYILLKLTPFSIWPSGLGALLFLLAPPMVDVHSMAWSEPLFILFSLLSFFSLGSYLERGEKIRLVIAACAAALASLTRYVGFVLIVSEIVGIVCVARKSWKKHLNDILIFGFISIIPITVLLIYNLQIAGSATNRILTYHLISGSQLWQGLTTVTSWIGLPGSMNTRIHIFFVILVFITLLALLAHYLKHGSRSDNTGDRIISIPPLLILISQYSCLYSLFLLFSISYLDAKTPLDNRILSPIFVNLLIIALFLIFNLKIDQASGLSRLFPIAILFVLLIIYGSTSIPRIQSRHMNGFGLSSLVWKNSELIRQVLLLPKSVSIFTNAPDAIYLHTNIPTIRLPLKRILTTNQENPNFAGEIKGLAENFPEKKAIIVFFNKKGRIENPSLEDIEAILDLEIQAQAADGWIYTLTNPAGE